MLLVNNSSMESKQAIKDAKTIQYYPLDDIVIIETRSITPSPAITLAIMDIG